MTTEAKKASPEALKRKVTMDGTPGQKAPVTRLPVQSPKTSAAWALSILCRQQHAPPPSTTNDAVAPTPSPAPTSTVAATESAYPAAAPYHSAPTPTFHHHPVAAAWQPQHPHPHYAPLQHHPSPATFSAPSSSKRIKVEHSQATASPRYSMVPHHGVVPHHHQHHPYAPSPYHHLHPHHPVVYHDNRVILGSHNYPPYHNHTPHPASMVTPTPQKKSYSRKTKSLGLLCENFVQTYRTTSHEISIDETAKQMGVERRRIYDIINVFESLDIVSRKCKNTYNWIGTDNLTQVFGRFQADALEDFAQDAVETGLVEGPVERREPPTYQKKSLSKLSLQFLQLFLVGHKVLALTDASDKILGTSTPTELASLAKQDAGINLNDPRQLQLAATRGLKTKIRRLYDIANIFCSLGLLKKLESDNKKVRPEFQWIYEKSARDIRDAHLVSDSNVSPPVLETSTKENIDDKGNANVTPAANTAKIHSSTPKGDTKTVTLEDAKVSPRDTITGSAQTAPGLATPTTVPASNAVTSATPLTATIDFAKIHSTGAEFCEGPQETLCRAVSLEGPTASKSISI